MVDFNANADVGCLRHCRRGPLIGADFFILQVLGWIGFGGWDADAFATQGQKPLIAGEDGIGSTDFYSRYRMRMAMASMIRRRRTKTASSLWPDLKIQ